MKHVFLLLICSLSMLVSCASNDDFEDRMDRRNTAYQNLGERREKRLEARQERTDAWFDRKMGTLDE